MDKIKAKIQSLCPDVMAEYCIGCGELTCDHSTTVCPKYVGSPITLAVVLRAISEVTIYVADGGEFFKFSGFDSEGSHVLTSANVHWNQLEAFIKAELESLAAEVEKGFTDASGKSIGRREAAAIIRNRANELDICKI